MGIRAASALLWTGLLLGAATTYAQDAAPESDDPLDGGFDFPDYDLGPGPDAAAAPVESGAAVVGWARFDASPGAMRGWVGASGELWGLPLAGDLYVQDSLTVLEAGLVFELGPLSLMPLAGIGVELAGPEVALLIAPQLYVTWNGDRVYAESWLQGRFGSLFDSRARGEADVFYTRDFLLVKLTERLYAGPQVELFSALNAEAGRGLLGLQLGGRLNLLLSASTTFGIFVGAELDDGWREGRDDVTGRLTIIQAL
jgi:hypothetical protein